MKFPTYFKRSRTSLICTWLAVATGVWGQEPSARDLMDSSIEELMNMRVVSVSKKSQTVSKTAAAVYVITQEEIRRSGVTSIPELLRTVPGVQVSRIDNSTWAISIRGFNDEFSNKLLVLVDGRSVYSELLSGVYWDHQQMSLDNVERIEVVRGPGAATWGANAVNGVINILTKDARDTQGGLIVAGGSSAERGPLAARWGGKLGGKSYYRVWGQYNRLETLYPDGVARPAYDRVGGEAGFRIDWESNGHDRFLAEGATFRHHDRKLVPNVSIEGPLGAMMEQRELFEGGHLLGRWSHSNAAGSGSELQVYFDREDMPQYQIPFSATTVDVDFHRQSRVSERHQLSWGTGYRSIHYNSAGTASYRLLRARESTNLLSFFAQDEVSLIPDRLSLTGGLKLEHNSFTGFEWEPTARLLWSHGEHAATWAAVSRAARTPSLAERFVSASVMVFPDPGSGMRVLLGATGNANFQSEYLTAYEAGHRVGLGSRVYADFALFWNQYHSLGGLSMTAPRAVMAPAPHIEIAEIFENGIAGHAYGGELAVNYAVNARWRLNAGYSRLHMTLRAPDGLTTVAISDPARSPRNQFQAGSLLGISKTLDLDAFVYMMGRLPGAPARMPSPAPNGVPAYVRADLRLGWRPRTDLEFSIGGQNLLRPRHLEQISYHVGVQSEASRSFVGSLKWSF